MRKIVLTLTAAALVLAVALPAQAQMAERWKDTLELTEQQTTQLQELHKQHQEEMAAGRAELIKAQAELRALQVVPERDIAAMEKAIREVARLRTEQQVAALKNREESLQVLTEAQRTKLETLRRARQGRAMDGRAGRGMSGRGMSGRGTHRPGMRTGRRPGGMGSGMMGSGRMGRDMQPRAGMGHGPGRGIHAPGTGRGVLPPPPPEK